MTTPKVQLAPSSNNNNHHIRSRRVVYNPYAKQKKSYPCKNVCPANEIKKQPTSKMISERLKTAAKSPSTNVSTIKNKMSESNYKANITIRNSATEPATETSSRMSSMNNSKVKHNIHRTSISMTGPNKSIIAVAVGAPTAIVVPPKSKPSTPATTTSKAKIVKKKTKKTNLTVAAQLKRDIAKLKKQKALAQEQKLRDAARRRKQQLEQQKHEENRLLQKERELRQEEKLRLRREKEAWAKAKREEQAKRRALQQTLKEREEQHQLQERKEKLYRQLKEREAQETKKMNDLLQQTPKVMQPSPTPCSSNSPIFEPLQSTQNKPPTTIVPSSSMALPPSNTITLAVTSMLPPQLPLHSQPISLSNTKVPFLPPPASTISTITPNMSLSPNSDNKNYHHSLFTSPPDTNSIHSNEIVGNQSTMMSTNTQFPSKNDCNIGNNNMEQDNANGDDYIPLNFIDSQVEEKEDDSVIWDSMIQDLLKPTTKEEEALVMTLFQQDDNSDDLSKYFDTSYNPTNNSHTMLHNCKSTSAPHPNHIASNPSTYTRNSQVSTSVSLSSTNPCQTTSASSHGELHPYSSIPHPNSQSSNIPYNDRGCHYPYHATTSKTPYGINSYVHPPRYHNNVTYYHQDFWKYSNMSPSWTPPMPWNQVRRTPALTKKPNTVKELRLCEHPLSYPSPFANTHVTLSFSIVLKKKTLQDSFGVNVRYHTRSVYVTTSDNVLASNTDNSEKMSEHTMVSKFESSSGTSEDKSTHSGTNPTSSITSTTKAITPIPHITEHNCNFTENAILPNYSVKLQPSPLKIDNEINEGTTIPPSPVSSNEAVSPISTNTDNDQNIPNNSTASIPPSKVTKENMDCHDKAFLSKPNDPLSTLPMSDTTKSISLTTQQNLTSAEIMKVKANSAIVSIDTAAKKKKKKRKTYGVMAVVNFKPTLTPDNDLNFQNGMMENEKKLFPGDIIISMEGTDLGGKTFTDACQLFPKAKPGEGDPASVSTNNEDYITCTMTVAREKKTMNILSKLSKLSQKKLIKNKQRSQSKPKKDKPSPGSSNESLPIPKHAGNLELNEMVTEAAQKEIQKDQEASDKLIQISKVPKEENNLAVSSDERVSTIQQSVNAQKEILLPMKMIPILVNRHTNAILSGEFSVEERMGWIQSIRLYFSNDPSQKDDILSFLFTTGKKHFRCLDQRDSSSLSKLWEHETNLILSFMKEKATLHWKQEWEKELEGKLDESFEFLSDTQRSSMRSLPRPIRGCKCGSMNHEHVDDIRCPLYRNIRNKSFSQEWNQDKLKSKKETSLPDKKQLNGIRAAFFERYKKMKEAKEKELEEATFVQSMERLQLSEQKMAIFAPRSLAVMILSTIAHLNRGTMDNEEIVCINKSNNERMKGSSSFSTESYTTTKSKKISTFDKSFSTSFDSDCNSTAMMLGKRANENVPTSAENGKTASNLSSMNKKRRVHIEGTNEEISVSFLAKILSHISLTWGHVFKEPDHLEFAWDNHLVASSTHVSNMIEDGALSKNPREPGSNSFESIRFALENNKSLSRLFKIGDQQTLKSRSSVEKCYRMINDLLIFHLASDEFTGLWSQLKRLLVRGIIKTTTCHDGIAFSLHENWDQKLPQNMLYDMWESGWHPLIDRENKFLLDKSLRETLCKKWNRTEEGMVTKPSLEDSEDEKIIYKHENYFEQRRVFEEKYENFVNEIDGVGKFGF